MRILPTAVAVVLGAALCLCPAAALVACSGQGSSGASSETGAPFGSSEASAELHRIMDGTLASQSPMFSWADETWGFNYPNVSFASDVYCGADDDVAAIEARLDGGDFDVLFARGEVVDALRADGYIDANDDALNVAELTFLDNVGLVAVRAKGSKAKMPTTRLVGGDDDLSSSEWRLKYLPSWKGTVAVCPDTTIEGRAFNQALYKVGLYSSGSGAGGEYDKSVKGKITVAASPDEVLALVRKGKADIGFVYDADANGAKGVEQFYEVPLALVDERPNYKGAVLSSSQNKDAARWYLNTLGQIS